MKFLKKIKNRLLYYPCMFCGKRDKKVFNFKVDHPSMGNKEWNFHISCLRDRIENPRAYNQKEVDMAVNIFSFLTAASGILDKLLGAKNE